MAMARGLTSTILGQHDIFVMSSCEKTSGAFFGWGLPGFIGAHGHQNKILGLARFRRFSSRLRTLCQRTPTTSFTEPPDPQQIDEWAPRKSPNSVFRFAAPPRPMANRQLSYTVSSAHCQGWHE